MTPLKEEFGFAAREQQRALARHDDGAESGLKESYFQARQEDEQRKSIVQQVVPRSADFLRRIIVPVQVQGGVTLSYACLHCHGFPLQDYIWVGVDGAR